MSAYDNACMSAYDKVNTVKLPQHFQFIPVNSRIFPLTPVNSHGKFLTFAGILQPYSPRFHLQD